MTEYTMRRRALHRAEPMLARRALSTVGLWFGVVALVVTGLMSLGVILAFLWGVFQAGLLLIHFLMGIVR